MQLAPVGSAIVGEEAGLRATDQGLVRQAPRPTQPDRATLLPPPTTEQALLTRLRAVLDGPRTIRVAGLHEPANVAHRRWALGQRQGVFHLDEGEGSRGGVDAPTPVDRVRFEIALDGAEEGLGRPDPERFLFRLHEGLQDAAIVCRKPPELGVAPRRLFHEKAIEAVIEGQHLRALPYLVGWNGRQRHLG